MPQATARDWIDRLRLQPHPEGGWFRETYRAARTVAPGCAEAATEGARAVSTAIYYLLTAECFSALHRVAHDELFHYYAGSPLVLYQIDADGEGRRDIVGPDVLEGQQPQRRVPAGVWQGAHLLAGGSYSLVGCTVAPGFDFGDFEMAQRDELVRQYPGRRAWIERLTR